jgi:hypothetical protein
MPPQVTQDMGAEDPIVLPRHFASKVEEPLCHDCNGAEENRRAKAAPTIN